MPFLLPDVINQMTCHGNLGCRLFTEAHSDGIANAIGQQSTNTYGAFDAPILTFAGLGHTQMQRIVHVFFLHFGHQQAHRPHHDHGVGGFNRNHHIVESLALTDA